MTSSLPTLRDAEWLTYVTTDTSTVSNSCVLEAEVCNLFEGNSNGDEPTKTATVPDGKTCATSTVSTSGC